MSAAGKPAHRAAAKQAPAKPAKVTIEEKITVDRATGPTDIHDPTLRAEAKRAGVWIGLAALAVAVVLMAQPLLVVFGGVVFGAMIDGGARLLGRILPIPRGWRIALVLVLTTLFLAWTVTFAGSQIARQAGEFPALIQAQIARGAAWLGAHGIPVDTSDLSGMSRQLLTGIGPVTRAVGGFIGGLATMFLIVVIGIYIAIDPHLYERGLAWMLPSTQRSDLHDTTAKMGQQLRRLMGGRLLGMVIEGVATGVALWIYGVPMAGLLGLLTGLLAFIPNVGAPISGLLMVIVGFSGGVDMGLFCIATYLVVQIIDSNVIMPMVAKKTVDLAPALVLAAQLVLGAAFGILGLALADPLLALIKIALEKRTEHLAGAHANGAKG